MNAAIVSIKDFQEPKLLNVSVLHKLCVMIIGRMEIKSYPGGKLCP